MKLVYTFLLLIRNGFREVFILLLIYVIATFIFGNEYISKTHVSKTVAALAARCIQIERNLEMQKQIVKEYYENRLNWTTSNLGSILFKNIEGEVFRHSSRVNRLYVVMMWKFCEEAKDHPVNLTTVPNSQLSILNECSVNNCRFTNNQAELTTADAVIVNVHRGKFPEVIERDPNQRWVFLTNESPNFIFAKAAIKPNLIDFANVFNWTMTYRSDSDIPVPYGRTVPLSAPIVDDITNEEVALLVPGWQTKRRDVLAAVLMSNCLTHRLRFVKEMQKYFSVHIHGLCSKDHKYSCPGHYKSDCKVLSNYLFYLVLENSSCRQYLTEKIFHNAYSKGAIPIIVGPPVKDCKKLLPPTSYLHIDNFGSPAELAKFVIRISKSDVTLLSLHKWRNHFEVVGEHGYFGTKSQHLCRICEALNYNDGDENVYNADDLMLFFDPNISCTSGEYSFENN